jgi:MFS family permease
VGAIRAGVRYVRHAPALQAVLIRAAAFIGSASALWALMPLVARQQLQLDARGYGMLLGCMGVGAVTAGVLLPKIRQRVEANPLVLGAAVICAIAFFVIANIPNFWIVCLMLTLTGAGWTSSMSSLNAAVQTSVPRWVQARALGIYQLVFQGGMAVGSAFWGLIAQQFGIAIALTGAAIGLLLGLLTAVPYRLLSNQQLDLSPSHHWSEPVVMVELRSEDGPILVTIEYRIDPMRAKEFVEAMHDISITRRRDGAIRWGLFFDTADPERYLETYIVESWAEHLCQHDRITVADRQASAHVLNYLVETPPKVTHLVYAHDRSESWLGLPGFKRA